MSDASCVSLILPRALLTHRPRAPVENWVNLLLPARSFGKIILTTSAGIMDHEEARRKHVSRGGLFLCVVGRRALTRFFLS